MTPFLSIVAAGLAWIVAAAVAAPAARSAGPDTTVVELGTGASSGLGFVAWPAKRRGAPTVLVAHDAAATAIVRDLARRFAREGYVAIVPAPPGDAAAADADGLARLESVCTWVHAQPDLKNSKIGVIGVGSTTGAAIRLALRGNAEAAVLWYGPFTIDPALKSLRVPLQIHLGADDPAVPSAWVDELRQAMVAAGQSGNVHVYAGAGAAFMNERGDSYHPDAARQAWARTLAFLQKHLKS